MTIEIRHCDDWIAVYKDGRKVEEGHSCDLRRGLRALGIEFRDVDLDDYIDWTGALTRDHPEVGATGDEPFPEVLP